MRVVERTTVGCRRRAGEALIRALSRHRLSGPTRVCSKVGHLMRFRVGLGYVGASRRRRFAATAIRLWCRTSTRKGGGHQRGRSPIVELGLDACCSVAPRRAASARPTTPGRRFARRRGAAVVGTPSPRTAARLVVPRRGSEHVAPHGKTTDLPSRRRPQHVRGGRWSVISPSPSHAERESGRSTATAWSPVNPES